MTKLLVIIIFLGIVIAGIYYISGFGHRPITCPNGEVYARAVTGGWATTDPSDAWGKCIPSSQVNTIINQ